MKWPYFSHAILLLMVSGCLSPRYSSLVNPSADFSKYRTFYCSECLETMDSRRPGYDNPENRRLIRDAIQKELEHRGYTFQEDHPDLLVEFDLIIKEHIDTVVQRTTNYRYWRGFEADTYNYKVGTLIINIVDYNEGIILWQGGAESFLDINPADFESSVNKVVKSIFKKYPYKIRH